jgi:hypothetical protein
MQNYREATCNVIMFLPKLSGRVTEIRPAKHSSNIIELNAAAREKASAKRYVPLSWTVDPNDLSAA